MGQVTKERWRKDRATLFRALRDFETRKATPPPECSWGDEDLDTVDQRIISIKRRIAELDALIRESGDDCSLGASIPQHRAVGRSLPR